MHFQHHRHLIWNRSQHPYKHKLSELEYTHPAFGNEIVNAEDAMDWVMAILYPNTEAYVADVASLPSSGNTIGDYRTVLDDGDGKMAGYRWEQREGDGSAQWYKIYDLDWSSDSIVAAVQDITQDQYVWKRGRDDADASGAALTGIDAGQHIYGGVTANTHLTLHANSGDGVGAQTGFIQHADNTRPTIDSTWTLGTTDYRWLNIFTDSITSGTLTATSGSITDTSGTIDFADENLTTTGSYTASTLEMMGGSITDTTGTIDFDDENLTTTGDITANSVTATGAASAFASGTTIGTLTLANGSITDSGGTIDFDDEDLSTTGDITAGSIDVTSGDFGNINIAGNTISSTNTDGNINLSADGAGIIDLQSNTTATRITASDYIQSDNIRIDGNTISSQNTDGNINLDPNGTGVVRSYASVIPDTDNVYDFGTTSLRWRNLYLSGAIGDGTTVIQNSVLQSFRDANAGVANGYALFWDAATSKWVASAPDVEIDHGTIYGLLDDDHTQYALLAGRSGGQILIGGADDNDNLTLGSTSSAVKGFIVAQDSIRPASDGDRNLGSATFRFDDLYMSGEGIGFRVQNVADYANLPAASGLNVARLAYTIDTADLWLDTGGTWKQISSDHYYNEDTTNWDGATTSVSYDVSATITNAKRMVWQLKNNSDDFAVMQGARITHTGDQNVTVTFQIPPASGTYTLVGAGR